VNPRKSERSTAPQIVIYLAGNTQIMPLKGETAEISWPPVVEQYSSVLKGQKLFLFPHDIKC
jgi:hypothetical protein